MKVNRKRCGLCQHENRADLEQALDSRSITCDELDATHGWRSGTSAQHQRNHMGILKCLLIQSVFSVPTL